MKQRGNEAVEAVKMQLRRKRDFTKTALASLFGLLCVVLEIAGSTTQVGLVSAAPKTLMSDSLVNKKKRPAQNSVPIGTWGGQSIRMIVRADGASIEYDCAHGEIAGKLVLNAERRFNLNGNHTREGPGPIRIGITQKSRPVRYEGKVTGDEMTLTVIMTETGESIGDFILKRGSEGRLRKCR